MQRRTFLTLALAAGMLGGCSGLKKLTKKGDNTVLPGTREDVLTPDQYRLKTPTTDARQTAAPAQTNADQPCDPKIKANCPPADGGNDGIFGDGQ
jgi:hypothetical protein